MNTPKSPRWSIEPQKLLSLHGMLLLLVLGVGIVRAAERPDARPGLGISSWAGWSPGQVSRTQCAELRSVPLIPRWSRLEPTPGEYVFDQEIGQRLRAADKDDLYVSIKIYVGPACPPWIYEIGVPLVTTDREFNALGQRTDSQSNYPYYPDPEYQKRFMALIDAFGAYVQGLPPALRKRIVFVQSAEGSTGDGQPYKGKPLDEKFRISEEAWNELRIAAWQRYQQALPGIPIVVNSDANSERENQWMLDHMEVIGLKHGMFSHGYQVSDNTRRLARFAALEAAAKQRGKTVLTRGEMDGELFVMGWAKQNIPQALYWSGIFATHCRLDVWNVPAKALLDEANRPALRFFNHYAGQKDPATAPSAFCALRDALDASDFERFPASDFGGQPEAKGHLTRYLNIAKAYEKYGARMDDPEKALGGGMLNRKSSGPNDVGWGIVAGNYGRFITQVEPGAGDVGRWNIDDTIYGRFGRAFEHAAGKRELRFKLDEGFRAKSAVVRVTYLDRGNGSWTLVTGGSRILHVENTDSGLWKTAELTVTRSDLHRSELQLRYARGADTVFHLIEVERRE